MHLIQYEFSITLDSADVHGLAMRALFVLMRTQAGRTALIYAAERGCTECARLLIDVGADKNATTEVRVDGAVVSKDTVLGFWYGCVLDDS